MGYRHYFYAVPKTQIEAIRKCETNEEFCGWAESAGYEVDRYEDDPPYMPVYHLGKELYCFGKYVDWAFTMQGKNESIFSTEELQEHYEDYRPVICSQEDFFSVIDIYRKKIASYLESLLSDEKDMPSEQKCKRDIEERFDLWENCMGYYTVDTDLKKSYITSSWLYEYSIFELVRLYKTFDWDNDALVLIGW